jgi:hypothetical protein
LSIFEGGNLGVSFLIATKPLGLKNFLDSIGRLTQLVCVGFANPKFISICELCRWLLAFVGWAPLAYLACLWVPLLPTCLALPLETPSFPCIRETPRFFPTTPVPLALSVLLVGRSSCQHDLPLGSPLVNFKQLYAT